jgi:hypothetical protein
MFGVCVEVQAALAKTAAASAWRCGADAKPAGPKMLLHEMHIDVVYSRNSVQEMALDAPWAVIRW